MIALKEKCSIPKSFQMLFRVRMQICLPKAASMDHSRNTPEGFSDGFLVVTVFN